MKKTAEQLQVELDREIAYTRKVNDKNARLMEENKELKKRLAECEQELSKIKRQVGEHTWRKAGRKRIASKKIAARVLELSGQGLSQAKIAVKIADEFNMKIKRTTVGEIVRGNYKLPDAD